MNNSATRISTLDALRGLAVLMVVLFHYTSRINASAYFHNMYNMGLGFSKGYLGVNLFFLISGFVIFMTIEKVKTSKEFILKRFFRLFPTYWLCIFLTYGAYVLCSMYLSPTNLPVVFKRSFIDVLGNLTMIQNLLRPIYNFKHIDGAYWSLLPELMFYVMMVVLYKFKLLKHIKIVGVVWLIISVVCIYFKVNFFMMGMILNFRYSSLFFGGIMFYLLWKNETERKKSNHLIIFFSFLVSCFMTVSLVDCVIIAMFYGLFYLFIYGKLNLNYKWLLFIGKISYPWYLLHQMIGYVILYYLHILFGFTSIFTIFIPILMTGLLAYIVTEYYENIIIRKLKYKFLTKNNS